MSPLSALLLPERLASVHRAGRFPDARRPGGPELTSRVGVKRVRHDRNLWRRGRDRRDGPGAGRVRSRRGSWDRPGRHRRAERRRRSRLQRAGRRKHAGGKPDPATPCGPRIEGPAVPCPDAATPVSPPPDATATPVPPAPPSPDCPADGPVTVNVRAWGPNHTCVYLRTGETAEITATGRWTARAAGKWDRRGPARTRAAVPGVRWWPGSRSSTSAPASARAAASPPSATDTFGCTRAAAGTRWRAAAPSPPPSWAAAAAEPYPRA